MITNKSIKEKALSLKNKCSQRNISAAIAATTGGLSLSILTGGASASVINVSQITGILSDMGLIFPSFGDLVVAIVPTIMTLAVVGFILKFFDKILAMIDKLV
ncbi:hypothetical protein ACSAZL_12475 [Methanosarcina sp. T3]|uniref:hypothetical protein n=1 Tax=Methanosarcina sp. T3 TaxID=3439062 RepID=UPI003F840085